MTEEIPPSHSLRLHMQNPEETLVEGTESTLSGRYLCICDAIRSKEGGLNDLRRIACQIASKLCRRLDTAKPFSGIFVLLIDKTID